MSNSIRTVERQLTDTASPMNTNALRDMLGMIRSLEARVAALEMARGVNVVFSEINPGDMLANALRARNLPDAYGR